MFAVDPDSWLAEADLTEEYFEKFGDKVPAKLRDELTRLRDRLTAAKEADRTRSQEGPSGGAALPRSGCFAPDGPTGSARWYRQ